MAKRIIVKVDRRMLIDDKNADELDEGYMQMFGWSPSHRVATGRHHGWQSNRRGSLISGPFLGTLEMTFGSWLPAGVWIPKVSIPICNPDHGHNKGQGDRRAWRPLSSN